MNEETLSGVPVTSSRPKAPTSDSGAAERITSAGVKRRNCATSTPNTSSSRDRRAPAAASGTRPAGSRSARRCCRNSRPARARPRARALTSRSPLPSPRPSSRAGDRDHLPQVLAEQLGRSLRRPDRRRSSRAGRSRPRPSSAETRGSSRGRSGTCRGSARARRSADRRAERGGHAGRAGPSASCVATAATVKPAFAARVGSMRTSSSGLPLLRNHEVHEPVDLSRRLGRARRPAVPSSARSSPKILTSTGSGLPSRSPSMSCSSCTNSISIAGHLPARSCARCSSMTSSTSVVALAARLQPHQDVAAVLLGREHPQLGAGAPGEAGDLRCRLQDAPRSAAACGRSRQRRALGVTVVDHVAAFVHLRQEAGLEAEDRSTAPSAATASVATIATRRGRLERARRSAR